MLTNSDPSPDDLNDAPADGIPVVSIVIPDAVVLKGLLYWQHKFNAGVVGGPQDGDDAYSY